MELSKNDVTFSVQADDPIALEKAINYVNLITKSNYRILSFKQLEVGIAKISIGKEEMSPENIFMLGKRYEILRTKPKLNF